MLTALVALFCLQAGCIFSPDKGDGGGPPPPPSYYVPARPDLVLQNLITAYQRRDSTVYKTIYDLDYEGKSTNPADPNPATQVSTFSWDSEVRHLANMARATTISQVVMDLGSATQWIREPSDNLAHPEYALIQLQNVHIQVFVGNDVYNVKQDSGEIFQFRFKPTTPAATSSSDTLWTIISWTEVLAP